MGVPERSELNQTPAAEFTIGSLLAPAVVETLIASGRIPGLVELSSPRGKIICFIPPEGTQIGDHIIRFAGAVIFASPDGQNRGMAKMCEVSEEPGSTIEKTHQSCSRAMR